MSDISPTSEPSLEEMLRIHAETLGKQGKPASRQLLIDAVEEIERLKKELRHWYVIKTVMW